MGTHTRYTLDIPPLRPARTRSTQFLFGSRRGYCEQISTSLAVMLRTLGIPAREATGYVPGPYDPLTDLYDVQAQDAHAWVQVWFPGYGWQSFDPTAVVPLANPQPGLGPRPRRRASASARSRAPGVAGVAAVGLVVLVVRRRRRRPRHLGRVHARRAGGDGRGGPACGRARRDPARRWPPASTPCGPHGGPPHTDARGWPLWPSAPPTATVRRTRAPSASCASPPDRRRRRGAAAGGRSPRPGGRRVSPGGGPAPRRSSPRQPAGAGSPSAGGAG